MDKFIIRGNNIPKTQIKQTIINRDGAMVDYYPNFLNKLESEALFKELSQLDWKIETTITKGGLKPTSRLVITIANPGFTSDHITYDTGPFSPLLKELKTKIETLLSTKFTHAYLNYYRNGKDHIGWHSDREEAPGAIIASISLGETRDFVLRHIKDTQKAQEMGDSCLKREYMDKAKLSIPLKSGDLLLMMGSTQQVYQHHVPARAGVTEPRINITFRS